MDVSQAFGCFLDDPQNPDGVSDALEAISRRRESVHDLPEVVGAELQDDGEVLERFRAVRGFERRVQKVPFIAEASRV